MVNQGGHTRRAGLGGENMLKPGSIDTQHEPSPVIFEVIIRRAAAEPQLVRDFRARTPSSHSAEAN